MVIPKVFVFSAACKLKLNESKSAVADCDEVRANFIFISFFFKVFFFFSSHKQRTSYGLLFWESRSVCCILFGRFLLTNFMDNIWVFVGNKAKRWISKQVLPESKGRQISEKRTFFTPWYLFRFALLPYYRRIILFFLGLIPWRQKRKSVLQKSAS